MISNKRVKLVLIFSFLFIISIISCKKTPTTPDAELLTRPIIWLNLFDLAFTASKAGSNPSSQVLQVKNAGQDSLCYSISDDSDWLTISPPGGTSTGEIIEHSVSIDKSGLKPQAEVYIATITLDCPEAYNNPQKVTVMLQLTKTPPPEISVNPANLTYSAKKGGTNPPHQNITIKNTGEGKLDYSVTSDVSWIKINPTSNTSRNNSNTHSVSVKIGGLDVGTHMGVITVADPDASNNPQTISVTLQIFDKDPPLIWANPSELTFSAKKEDSNPPSQTIKIKNTGEQALNYSLSVDSDWLDVKPKSGSSTGQENSHTVSADIAGLNEGTYSGKITITDPEAGNSPQTINVTLTVSKKSPPQIWISITSLTFSAEEGGSNPSSQRIKIKNIGQQTLNYSISDNANWLSVSPTSGSSTGGENTHVVSVDTKGMSKGNHSGTITISDTNASNSPQTVNVSLAISVTPPPQIWVSPSSLAFSGEEGGSNPSSQSIKIKNSGEQTLNYSISDNANWLSVSPTSGSSTGGENTHTITVDISGLNTGIYSGTITISDSSAGNSPQTVSVTLNITAQQSPQIWVSPSSLSSSAEVGGSNPPSQNIQIKNSGGQTLNYNISDNANWLSVSPTSGSSNGSENTHTVSLDITGLSTGAYNGTITISDSSASNSPQTVSVTLNVTAQSSPQIWVSPSSLSFSAQEGGSNPSSQTLKIKNSGSQTLNYSISDDAIWLSVSPTSGSSTGGENSHSVSVDISGLSQGSYTGTITITDPNASNNPQTAGVTLTINAALGDNEIGISCSPSSGGTDTIIDIPISINGNQKVITYFGLKLTFDTSVFQFVSVSKGSLTGSWATVDGNPISGTVTIGGYAGSGTPVPVGSNGSIAVVKLKVTCSGCSDGQQSQISIDNYTDDISGMTPEPAKTIFTYRN